MEEAQLILIEWLKQGGEFVISEAPQVAAEIVTLGQAYFYFSVVALILSVIGIIGSALYARQADRFEDGWVPVMAISIFAFFISFVFSVVNIAAIIAPKVYVLRYLGGL